MQQSREDWECNNQTYQLGCFCFSKWPLRARLDFFPLTDFLFPSELTEAAECLLVFFFPWHSKMPVLLQTAVSSYFSEYSPIVLAHFLSWVICLVFTYWIMTMDYLTHVSSHGIPFNDLFFFLSGIAAISFVLHISFVIPLSLDLQSWEVICVYIMLRGHRC